MTIRAGLDIDGVITADPGRFSALSLHLMKSGMDVRIVTSRSAQAKRETEQELAAFGISYSELFFLPEISLAQKLCPHRSLNWFDRYLWQKADYALQHNLSHFVDDEAAIERLFKIYAPQIAFARYPDSVAWGEFLQLVGTEG